MSSGRKGPYDDIIGTRYPFALLKPRMSRLERAAQFAPFEALEGSREMVEESERQTTADRPLDEEQLQELDRKFSYIIDRKIVNPKVILQVFVEDEFKEGGTIRTYEGTLRFIDKAGGQLILSDGTRIMLESIRDFRCDSIEES